MTFRQNVEASHRTTYAGVIQNVAQEYTSKIRQAFTIETGLTGDAHNVRDLLDKREYSESEDYSHQNPQKRSNLDPVWLMRPKVVEDGEVIYKEDKFDLAMDPTARFNINMVKACERGVFDRFVGVKRKNDGSFAIGGGGLLGARVSGKNHSTQTQLPSAQYLAANLGGGGSATGLNLEKLIEAREKLELADFGLDEDLSDELFCLISPKQKTDLLNIAAATGTNLNQFELEQIRTGKPTSLMGLTWMFTNRLPKNSSGQRICPIWTKSNVIGAFWQDVEGDMWNLSEAKNRPYCYVSAYPTGTRIEDTGVIAIPCAES